MSNNYRMSYFMPPIAPIKDKQGRLMAPPTLIPFCEVSIEQVFQMITCNENLKEPKTQTNRETLLLRYLQGTGSKQKVMGGGKGLYRHLL